MWWWCGRSRSRSRSRGAKGGGALDGAAGSGAGRGIGCADVEWTGVTRAVDDVCRLRVRVGGVAGSVQLLLRRTEWQATKSREKEERREETRGDKSISRALQAAPRFYEGLLACPPATASTHPTPAIPPAPPLPGREQARPRGQLAFLSLAAARAPQCTANHGAMTRRGWARGASVGASGGGHGVAVVAGVGLGCQDG
jgi:hypothetical protein